MPRRPRPRPRRLIRLASASALLTGGATTDVAAFHTGPQPAAARPRPLFAPPSSPPQPAIVPLPPAYSPTKSSAAAFANVVTARGRCRLHTASTLDALMNLPFPSDDKQEEDADARSAGLGGKLRSLLRMNGAKDITTTATFPSAAGSNRQMLRKNAFAILAGLCLSFNAGYVNGACMSGLLHSSGAKVSVAGFTGAYTQAGLALASGDFATFSFFAKMISSFVGGSMLSGLLNPKPTPGRMGPTYGPTFLLGSILLAVSSVLAFRSAPGLAVFRLAAAANGLQNGMSSMYTANLVRSSHMSGTSTDIGMILGQVLGGNRENAWKALVLTSLASSFTLGGALSYLAVAKFRSLALAFNAAFFLAIGVASIAYTSIQEHVTLWQAASGRWKWKSHTPPTADDLSRLFDMIDADGNGYLDREEMRAVLKEAGMIVSDADIAAMFIMADTDGDGTISRDEFFALIMCNAQGEDCEVKDPATAIVATTRRQWRKAIGSLV